MFEKLKELTKDTVIYGISTIVGRFLGFILVPFYTNVFSTEEFGHYTLVYTYLSFLAVVYIYGMDAAFMKYTSLAEGEEKRDTFSTPFWFVTITTSVLSVLFLIFRHQIATAINLDSNYSGLLIYVIGILFLDTLALIPFANLRLERKTKKFAGIKLLNIVLNLSLNLVLILKYKMGIEAIFISNLIASAFSVAVLTPEIARKIKIRISKPVLKKMVKFGIPYLPASIASTMVAVIDVPIVKELAGESTLGIYRANYKLGIFMMLFVSMFNFAWQPFLLTNAKDKNAKEVFSKVLTLFTLVGGFIWVVLSLFIEDFATIELWGGKTLIGKDFLGGIIIVPIILLAYLFYGLYVNFTAGIYIEEKTNYFPYVSGAGAAVNVLVNIFAIPKFGIMGAAFATLASYFVMAIGLFLIVQKFYPIKYEYSKIVGVFLVIAIIAGCYYSLYYAGYLNLGYKVLMLIGYVVLLFLLRVLNLTEIKTTTKRLLRRN